MANPPDGAGSTADPARGVGVVDRDRRADERDGTADERDRRADEREASADERDRRADEREASADARDRDADERDWAAEKREFVADERQQLADVREAAADQREELADTRDAMSGALQRELNEASHLRQSAAAARALVDDARDRADLPRPLAREFLEITRALSHHHQGDVEPFHEVLMIAARIVDRCDEASYTNKAAAGFATVASTGIEAHEIDQLQYRAGEGPCIDAYESGQSVVSADLRADDRWPTFTAELATTVARSVMSSPVTEVERHDVVFGSMNYYGTAGSPFDDEDLESAMLLSAHLASLLSLRASHEGEVEDLQQALLSRDIIGQAKGILMARQGISADEAFDVLRRASQRLNRKLRDIAGDLIVGSIDASAAQVGAQDGGDHASPTVPARPPR